MPVDPFSYAEQFNPRNRRTQLPPNQTTAADPVDAIIDRIRADDTRVTLLHGPEPDHVARVNRVAREADVPPVMAEDSVGSLEKLTQVRRTADVMGQYPSVGKWAAQNPRGALAAADDHKSLGLLGDAFAWLKDHDPVMGFARWLDNFDQTDAGTRYVPGPLKPASLIMAGTASIMGDQAAQQAFGRTAKVAPKAILAGSSSLASGAVGYARGIAENVGAENAAGALARWSAGADAYAKRTMPHSADWVTEQLIGGVAQTPNSIASLGVGIGGRALGLGVKGASLAGALTGGVIQGGQSYNDARAQGVDPGKAFAYANADLASEVAGEYVGELPFLRATHAGSSAMKRFFQSQIGEQAGEQFSTIAQDFSAWAVLPSNRDKTFGDYLKQLPGDLASTAAQTLVAGGLTNLTITGIENLFGSSAAKARDQVRNDAREAVIAQQQAAFIDQAGKAATESKLRARDPEAHADLTRAMAEDAGIDSVFIPGDKLTEYFQSDSYDRYSDPLREWEDAADEAASYGGDVIIPADVALSRMPGTPAWSALKDEMRLTAGGQSAREAADFEANISEHLDQLEAGVAKAELDSRDAKQAIEKLTDKIAAKLGNSYASPEARQMAQVTASYIVSRAERNGVAVTGNEFDHVDINQVMPAALAELRKADGTDLVINAMRRSGKPDASQGPSLLEWIASRGGVEDRGGDIASMGGDKWHRGKVGRRKLIKPHDEAQGNMLGGATNDNSIERLFDAAISAGYFPDLLARREAGEKLDNRTMLDAIGSELAGSPIHAQDAREDHVRAAAKELETLLGQQGYSPTDMSDAEIRDALDKLASDGPSGGYDQGDVVATLTGTEIAPAGDTLQHLRAKAKDWYLQHLRGKSAQSSALGRPVQFASPKKMLAFTADAEKLRAIPALREIIENGTLLSSAPPHDQGKAPSIKAYHRLGATIKIGDSIKRVEVTIREANNGDFFYDHVLPENAARNPESPGNKTGTGETGGALDQIAPSQDKFNLVVIGAGESRGSIQFDQGRVLISLHQSRNLSTYFHEFGHMALENLRADAQMPDANDTLKADWQTVQDWFAANGHPIEDGTIPVEAHELWARGVERYMMEGKAPSTGLQRIFETVRGWLTAIYKSVEALRSPITPEIRDVMSRLIATDAEIEAMADRQSLQALFKSAADAGMTDAEFGAYGRLVDEARTDARSKLTDKVMGAARRKVEKQYREERAEIAAAVGDDLDQVPMFRALAAMSAQPIDSQWVRDELGIDAPSMLPRRVPPIHRDGGANPADVAELAGFGTPREMIEALIGAEQTRRDAREGGDQRSLRTMMIDRAVDAEMARRHGDTLIDGSIEREALDALHSERQGEVIAAELRVLARGSGRRATPYRVARDWARGRVRAGRVTDEASPAAIQRYARNAAKAGREAEKAMLARDADTAFRQKQSQMLNNALVAEAKAAADEVDAAVKRMGKVASRDTMKSVDQDYLEQAQALLEAVDLKRATQKSIDRRGRFEAWAAEQEAQGIDVAVPSSFEAQLGTTHWTRLPVDQLLALDAAVKQVMHLGRMKQKLLDNKEQRDFDAAVGEAVSGAGNIKGPPPTTLDDPSWGEALKARVMGGDAALLKMETVFDWLDGGDSNGVFNRIAFRPVSEAQAREADMLKDYYARIKALFEAVPERQVARWADKVELPFTFRDKPVRFPRQKLVAMALNIGNEGNLQRLADGYGWNAGAIEAHLVSELSADEWSFVQGVWDVIDTLWPELSAMERRINGIEPDKVEARSFETPHGKMRGGYYPAIYDSSLDLKTEERRGRETDLFESNYTRATTRSSASKARADQVRRPILLDLGVINRHLGEVIHDITHREAVMQAHKFLTDARVAGAVDEALGPEIRKMFRPWVKFVANSWAMERAGNEGFGKWIGKLRANATAVGLGLRATTMVTQIAGYSNSTEVIGEKWMAQGLAQFSAHPIDTGRFVLDRSDEVRHRMDTLDRDLRTEIARISAKNVASKGLARLDEAKVFMFHGIGLMDRAVVVPTWIGAYNKAQAEGMAEPDAAYYADKVVRQSQGAGAPKDLADIQRGAGKWGEAHKLFTMFYSYFSASYQRQRTLTRDVRGADPRRSRNMPRLVARAFWLMVVPPLLVELLKVPLGAGGPDDDEWWAQWTMRKLIANSLGGIPVARDLFEPVWNKAIKGNFYNPAISPIQRAYDSVVKSAGDFGSQVRGEDTKHATKDYLETAGYVTGLVPGQVASASQFMVDVAQGDEDPQSAADWLEGLSKGKLD